MVAKQRSTGGPLFTDEDEDRQNGATKELSREVDLREHARRVERNFAFGPWVAIYAPGMPPWKYPPDTAMKIPKGSLLVFQLHYTPNGRKQVDRSYVGFKLAKPEDVKQEIHYGLAYNTELEIPPYAVEHTETASVKMRADSLLLNICPHMHYRGTAIRVEALYPDQSREILLDVPRFDFNWQMRYDLAEPKFLPKGTRLVCTGVFDNSAENLRNPDPSKKVRFGLQTWEEMLVGYYTTVLAGQDLPRERLVNSLKAVLPNEFWLGVIGSVAMWACVIAIYRFVVRRRRPRTAIDAILKVDPPSTRNV